MPRTRESTAREPQHHEGSSEREQGWLTASKFSFIADCTRVGSKKITHTNENISYSSSCILPLRHVFRNCASQSTYGGTTVWCMENLFDSPSIELVQAHDNKSVPRFVFSTIEYILVLKMLIFTHPFHMAWISSRVHPRTYSCGIKCVKRLSYQRSGKTPTNDTQVFYLVDII